MKRAILFLIIISTTAFNTYAQPLNPGAPFVSLPVVLTTFTAIAENGSAHLSWQTTQELNSSVFDIEHSGDGTQWTKTGSVKAAGNNSLTHDYSFIHTQPDPGKNYYRLKMVDLDGSWELSHTLQVTINTPAGIRIYPMPVTDYLVIAINGFRESLPYTILNAKGKEVKQGIITQNNQRVAIPDLPAGLYFFKTEKFESVKFLK
jgi:hypothetical protein